MKHLRQKIVYIALPCVVLFILLYVLPFFITVGYSVLNNAFDMDYVGIDNYVSVFDNQYFQMALRNTIRVTCVLVVVSAIAALSLGFFLQHRKGKGMGLLILLVLPMLVPSVSCAAIWREVFKTDSFAPTGTCYIALTSLFAWKYTGVAALLLYAGLQDINPLLLDAAALDGAGTIRSYLQISLPCIRNHIAIMLMLVLMFALRIYKESYLLFGLYPNDDMYLIAHYMSNHFIKMNYQNVAVSSVCLAVMGLLLAGLASLGRNKEATI